MAKAGEAGFKLSTVLTTALLVGFLGFGVGFRYPLIHDRLSSWLGKDDQKLPADLSYGDVEEVYDALRAKYAGGQLDAKTLLEGAKRGLVNAAGDPYTEYLDEAAAKEFQADLSGTFSGIGAEIAIKNEQLVVIAPVAGSPAKAVGLRAGDAIVKINDETTENMGVEVAVRKIRGEAGSQVRLTIIRGGGEPQELTITRSVINVPSVTSELKSGNVGYIQLARFDNDTAGALAKEANSLKQRGATKFIIDLRNNPGGLLDSAVAVSDESLDIGKVVVEERKDGEVLQTERSTSGGTLLGAPTMVLINEGSASASEIVAGALHDNGAATLVGSKSFGKGSVQEILDLNGRSALKVTVALWYTPAGRNISKEGIEPDIKVELSRDDFNNNRDPQLERALAEIQNR